MKFFLLAAFILLTPCVSFSKSKSLSDTKKSTKKSKTITVLEMSKATKVYKSPNFDSKVIAKLPPGKKVLGSIKNYEGTDGFGLFHKVRLKKGSFGYVLDTDIKGFKPGGLFLKPKKKRGGFFSRSRNTNQNLSPTRSKSVGLTYSYMKYNIKAVDQTLSSGSSLFGLKFTGPWLTRNLPLDITLFLSPGAPDFFDSISSEATGFFGFLDISYQSIVMKAPNQEAYWSIGPALSYYNFDVIYNGEVDPLASSQLDIGVSAGLGWAYNFNSFVARLEGRYYRTNESHYALLLSIQRYF